jgi:type I restriction enzyme R subunit
MEENIKNAIKLYSGNKPLGLFVQKLDQNLEQMNNLFDEILELFHQAEISNFEKIPEEPSERSKFVSLFNKFNSYLEAARIQGFCWDKMLYTFEKGKKIKVKIDEKAYLILALRYKEVAKKIDKDNDDVSFEIDGYLTEIDTETINDNYLNSRFKKYLKLLNQDNIDEKIKQKTLDDLHKSFASLSQEDQKYANIFLHDIQRGDAHLDNSKSFIDYVTEYKFNAKHKQILYCSQYLGLEEEVLSNFMDKAVSEKNLNEYGRFDNLKNQVDIKKAKEFFEKTEKKSVKPYEVKMKVHTFLHDFILSGGYEIEEE